MTSYEQHISAAATARLLGYKVSRGKTLESYMSLAVLSPTGQRVLAFNGAVEGIHSRVKRMPDYEALGHFLVRLHMEKHYGVKTMHYWE